MNKLLMDIIIGRYGSMVKFWKEYQRITNKKLSTSYRYKLIRGIKEIPDDMYNTIYVTMLEIEPMEIMDLISRIYIVRKRLGKKIPVSKNPR